MEGLQKSIADDLLLVLEHNTCRSNGAPAIFCRDRKAIAFAYNRLRNAVLTSFCLGRCVTGTGPVPRIAI